MAKPLDQEGEAQVGRASGSGNSEKVAFDASVQSGALNKGFYKVTVTQDCFMAQGANPTAVADTDEFMQANSIQFVEISEANNKLAFIKSSVAGNAYLTPYK
jgi:hypothetical protein